MNSLDLRSETLRRFAAWKLSANEYLPLLESHTDLRPKSASLVAARAVASGYVAAFCFGAPLEKVRAALERFSLWAHLSTEEQVLLSNPPSEAQVAFHSWLVEAVQFMAWSLGVTALDHLAPGADTVARQFPAPGSDPRQFIAGARLRPLVELLQEADTLYMLHWAAVDAQINGAADERLVLPRLSFRRHAADWIVGVAEAWDDVPMDT